MIFWEYEREEFDPQKDDWLGVLNQRGGDRWELVHVTPPVMVGAELTSGLGFRGGRLTAHLTFKRVIHEGRE